MKKITFFILTEFTAHIIAAEDIASVRQGRNDHSEQSGHVLSNTTVMKERTRSSGWSYKIS